MRSPVSRTGWSNRAITGVLIAIRRLLKNTVSVWFGFVTIAAIAWLWFPYWGQSRVPAFRDGFHFYYPQFVWLDHRYQDGEYFPGWNANEGLGASVTGQPTWQLLYPLRGLWWLPMGGLPQRLALWFAAHQIIAVWGIKRLATELKLSSPAGWVAGIAYALSCPVVFQHTNTVYLCSAAWIGFVLVQFIRLLLSKKILSSLWQLTVFCSLMLLAGDPQNAVNAGLIGMVALATGFPCILRRSAWVGRVAAKLGIAWRDSSDERITSIALPSTVNRFRTRCSDRVEWYLWNAIGLTIVALALLQSFETWKWYRHSARSPNATQFTDSFNQQVAAILASKAEATPHRVFDFSVSPWSLPSLVWPTIGGHYQSVHSRWVDVLSSEGRMWTPSLYVGLLPLLLVGVKLGQSSDRVNSKRVRIEWFFLGLALLALLFAMGNYSFGWFFREFVWAIGLKDWTVQWPPDSTGSLYGLLTQVVPGYDRFRYPAKWLVWFVASVSILAGIQLDRTVADRSSFLRFASCGIWVVASSLLVVVIWSVVRTFGMIGNPFDEGWLQASFDPLLGYADSIESVHQVSFATHWPIVVLCVFGLTVYVLRSVSIQWTIALLTLIEMSICCRSWITTTPAPSIVAASTLGRSETIRWANTRQADISDMRRGNLRKSQASPYDQSDQIALQTTYMFGKLAHLQNVGGLHAAGSLRPRAVVRLEDWLSRHDDMSPNQPQLDEILEYLGVTQRLVRGDDGSFRWTQIPNVRPLCEIILDERGASTHSSRLSWRWLSSSTLHVEVAVARESKLIIRQFNDGNWHVERSASPSVQIDPNELFLVIQVPSGKHSIHIER